MVKTNTWILIICISLSFALRATSEEVKKSEISKRSVEMEGQENLETFANKLKMLKQVILENYLAAKLEDYEDGNDMSSENDESENEMKEMKRNRMSFKKRNRMSFKKRSRMDFKKRGRMEFKKREDMGDEDLNRYLRNRMIFRKRGMRMNF